MISCTFMQTVSPQLDCFSIVTVSVFMSCAGIPGSIRSLCYQWPPAWAWRVRMKRPGTHPGTETSTPASTTPACWTSWSQKGKSTSLCPTLTTWAPQWTCISWTTWWVSPVTNAVNSSWRSPIRPELTWRWVESPCWCIAHDLSEYNSRAVFYDFRLVSNDLRVNKWREMVLWRLWCTSGKVKEQTGVTSFWTKSGQN